MTFVDCPVDFTYVKSVDGCYKVVTRNSEWLLAALECRWLNPDAHLLVVNSSKEQAAVAGLLANVDSKCSHIHCTLYS